VSDSLVMMLGWTGVFAPAALAAVGSTIGCSIAGRAAIGALLEVEGRYGVYIGTSALPSSQAIYGIVLMFSLQRPVTADTAGGLAAIGLLSGLAFMVSAVYQGQCCASSINVSKSKPEVLALTIAPAAIVEGFAVFVLVFALVLSAGLAGR
jgi:V/A-type H+-transporting ATPase subunit K